MNAHLQETLRGVEVIQAFRRQPMFVHRFRQVLRRGLGASNRSTIYAALYPPLTALMTYPVIALLLWIGTRDPSGAFGVSIGTLTAFALLLQRFFTPLTALGDEWQTVQSALSGAERVLEVLSLSAEARPLRSGERPTCDRLQKRRLRVCRRNGGASPRNIAGRAGRTRGTRGPHRSGE